LSAEPTDFITDQALNLTSLLYLSVIHFRVFPVYLAFPIGYHE